MGTLIAHWKEVSIILTGVFAVVGVFCDTRDKTTRSVTIWGKVFLVLTIFSVSMAFLAHVIENEQAQKKNREIQEHMLLVQNRTAKTVEELSKILQPASPLSINIAFDLDCSLPQSRTLCLRVYRLADAATKDGSFGPGDAWKFEGIDQLDGYEQVWLKGKSCQIDILFFRRNIKPAGNDCEFCDSDSSVSLYSILQSKDSNVSYWYFPKSKSISVEINKTLNEGLGSRFLSVLDFLGSTVGIVEDCGLFQHLRPNQLRLTTGRGQVVGYSDFGSGRLELRTLYWSTNVNLN